MSKVPIGKLLLLFLFGLGSSAYAQNTEQILEVGHEYYSKGDYLGASKVYKQALDIDSSNAEVLYYYSKSLMEMMQMELASRYLFKASLIDKGENFPDVYYLLAESYRGSGDYRKARRYYSKALIPYRSDRKSYWYQRIDQSKDANNWAMKQKVVNDEIQAFDNQFNTDASEYGARIIDGDLYFSSLRADSLEDGEIVNDLHYFNRIYHSNINKKGSALEVKTESELKDYHLANISFHKKKSKHVYFSACDTNYNCQIWEGEFENNRITKQKALNKNVNFPNYNNTQPEVFSYKGKEYIVFSSNRPRGFGGMDLWIAEKKEFGFDEAINLGSSINTQGDEITPYYQDGWLYFSSDWHIGFGGFDIFKTSGWLSGFEEAKNLGSPINSPADDYYFSRSNGQAILSSNRKLDNSENYCCNNLYYLPYEELALEEEEEAADTLVPDIITLNKYLPLDLYFHNDIPNPNSQDSTTKENYILLAKDYLKMKDEYLSQFDEGGQYVKDEDVKLELEAFFEDEVGGGISDLEFFTPLLHKALESGSQIELSIKGFASSVSAAEYNLKLTLRRIESLINYFKEYNSGALLPYINNTNSSGGSLKIKKIPFGEFAFNDPSIEKDKILAVYSPQAASQRKIELIAVSNQGGEKKKFDSQEGYEPPKMSFNSKSYDLGLVEQNDLSRVFLVKNEGGSALDIYNIMVNCDCAQIEYPSTLEAKEEGQIRIEIDATNMKGEIELILTIVSNTDPNLTDLKISLKK